MGYTFEEWNTKANGNGISFDAEDEITVTEDMTLYAQWESLGGNKKVKFKNTSKTVEKSKIKTEDYKYGIIKNSGGGRVIVLYTGKAAKYISVSESGNVTVRKKTPKGTYKFTVRVLPGGSYIVGQKDCKVKVKE